MESCELKIDSGEWIIGEMRENVIEAKSYAFALRIVKLGKFLNREHKEFVLSKQVLRSGTAIDALIREAQHAQSKADFISKMSIALKEANETDYWLNLLHDSDYLPSDHFTSIQKDAQEVLKPLISIVKSSRSNPA